MNFQTVAHEWYARWSLERVPDYARESLAIIKKYILPALGQRELSSIAPVDILQLLRPLEQRGIIITTHKVLGHINKIFRYAITCGYVLTNPARDLSAALRPRRSKHMAAILDPSEVGKLLLAIDNYGFKQRKNSLRLLAHTFVRAGELTSMAWKDIDWESKTWNIPAENMKMKRAHSVPLSTQAIAILKEQKVIAGDSPWVFPSRWDKSKHENSNALTYGLRHIGYKSGEVSAHGFRAMAATLLSEMDWDSQLIERELAHVDTNTVRAAYQRSDLLEKRRVMMQAWSDWLENALAKAYYKTKPQVKPRVRRSASPRPVVMPQMFFQPFMYQPGFPLTMTAAYITGRPLGSVEALRR